MMGFPSTGLLLLWGDSAKWMFHWQNALANNKNSASEFPTHLLLLRMRLQNYEKIP
jgi:hypothetical protein